VFAPFSLGKLGTQRLQKEFMHLEDTQNETPNTILQITEGKLCIIEFFMLLKIVDRCWRTLLAFAVV
jgi:hypothetical protein